MADDEHNDNTNEDDMTNDFGTSEVTVEGDKFNGNAAHSYSNNADDEKQAPGYKPTSGSSESSTSSSSYEGSNPSNYTQEDTGSDDDSNDRQQFAITSKQPHSLQQPKLSLRRQQRQITHHRMGGMVSICSVLPPILEETSDIDTSYSSKMSELRLSFKSDDGNIVNLVSAEHRSHDNFVASMPELNQSPQQQNFSPSSNSFMKALNLVNSEARFKSKVFGSPLDAKKPCCDKIEPASEGNHHDYILNTQQSKQRETFNIRKHLSRHRKQSKSFNNKRDEKERSKSESPRGDESIEKSKSQRHSSRQNNAEINAKNGVKDQSSSSSALHKINSRDKLAKFHAKQYKKSSNYNEFSEVDSNEGSDEGHTGSSHIDSSERSHGRHTRQSNFRKSGLTSSFPQCSGLNALNTNDRGELLSWDDLEDAIYIGLHNSISDLNLEINHKQEWKQHSGDNDNSIAIIPSASNIPRQNASDQISASQFASSQFASSQPNEDCNHHTQQNRTTAISTNDSDRVKGPWRCAKCTFINENPLHLVCKVCTVPRD